MLSPDEIFSGLRAARGLLVAVSGGPDSLALLALAADWSKGEKSPPIHAATFDHGFREASRREAELCAAIARDLGVPHAILDWTGARPVTRIQEEARDARYDALVAHARMIGADTILTAHHADDQAETILFRLMRGSAIGGLAGMQRMRDLGGVSHVRPLLHLRKAELVAFCDERGLPYVVDPSNADPRFARTGLRRLAALMEEAGMGPEAFSRLAARAGRAEKALRAAADELSMRTVLARNEQATRLDGPALAAAPAELAIRVIMAEIACVGRPPRLEQAEPFVEVLLDHARRGQAWRANLAGALVSVRKDGTILIAPEPSRRA